MIPLRPARAILLLVGGVAVSLVLGQSHPLLERAGKAMSQLSYAGVRVTTFKGKPVTERVFVTPGFRRVEREGTVIIETPAKKYVYERSSNTLRFINVRRPMGGMKPNGNRPGKRNGQPLPGGFGQDRKFDPAKFSYDVADGGLVAGRATKLVTATAEGGAGRSQFWIDTQTGLMLRAAAPAFGNRPPMDFEFTQISFGDQPKGLFVADFPNATVVDARTDLAKVSRMLGVPPFTIPDDGPFELVRAEKKTIAGRDVMAQTFRAGPKVISLFVTTGSVSRENLNKMVRNGSVVTWTSGNYSLVLLGNVPNGELQQLQQRVRA